MINAFRKILLLVVFSIIGLAGFYFLENLNIIQQTPMDLVKQKKTTRFDWCF